MKICSKCNNIVLKLVHHIIPHDKNSVIICDKCYQAGRYEILSKDKDWKEKRRIYCNLYNAKNREKVRANKHRYIKENLEVIRTYKNEYAKQKASDDINFRLARQLRNRLNEAIKHNYKAGSAVKDLGCSIDFFKTYIESLWLPNMTWKNQGRGFDKWHIDHIIPLKAFDLTDLEQFLKAVHYTNLQPLWEPDNLRKGSK